MQVYPMLILTNGEILSFHAPNERQNACGCGVMPPPLYDWLDMYRDILEIHHLRLPFKRRTLLNDLMRSFGGWSLNLSLVLVAQKTFFGAVFNKKKTERERKNKKKRRRTRLLNNERHWTSKFLKRENNGTVGQPTKSNHVHSCKQQLYKYIHGIYMLFIYLFLIKYICYLYMCI